MKRDSEILIIGFVLGVVTSLIANVITEKWKADGKL